MASKFLTGCVSLIFGALAGIFLQTWVSFGLAEHFVAFFLCAVMALVLFYLTFEKENPRGK